MVKKWNEYELCWMNLISDPVRILVQDLEYVPLFPCSDMTGEALGVMMGYGSNQMGIDDKVRKRI